MANDKAFGRLGASRAEGPSALARSASTHLALLIPTDNGQPGRSIGRTEPQRPMRTVLVVVLDVDAQDVLQMPSPDD